MTGHSASDAALIQACLSGNRSAFGQIVERYQAMACAIAYSVVGDRSASEDTAQEAFVAAWQQLPRLKERDKLRNWLAGIVRNLAHNAVRRRRTDLVAQAEAVDAMAPPADVAAPDEAVADKEEETILWRALEEIPEQFREPLVLYYREHQSVAEVSEAMGISVDAVKQRLARGRLALKEQVADYVERTLRRTGPKAAFTAGVLAAIETTSGTAAAAGVGAGTGTAAGAVGSGALWGILGGVFGSLIGLAGGIFGTACSIKNARSPAERAFIVKMAWVAWIYSTVLVGAFLYVAFWQRWLCESVWFQVTFWSLHAVVLITGILWGNRTAARLAKVDGDGQKN